MAKDSRNDRNGPGMRDTGLKPLPKPVGLNMRPPQGRSSPKASPAQGRSSQKAASMQGRPSQKTPPPHLKVFKTNPAPAINKPQKRKTDEIKILLIGTAVVAAVIGLIAIAVWALTNKNAYEVFVNEKSIGYIAYNKNITETALYNTAVKKLAENVGSAVKVDDKVTLKRVHKTKSLMSPDNMETEIYKKFTYTVEAYAISVNGIEMAVLKSLKEAEDVKTRLIDKYAPENADNIIYKDFAEPFIIAPRYVDKEIITTTEKAYAALSSSSEQQMAYMVRSGDNLTRIAARYNITINDIKRLNPGVDEYTVLNIGRELVLMVPKPLLSVEIVREEKETVAKPKEIEYRENPEQYKTYTKVIQQGKDGQVENTVHVTSVNGVVTEKKIVNTQTLVPSVTEIVEVGTKQTPTRN